MPRIFVLVSLYMEIDPFKKKLNKLLTWEKIYLTLNSYLLCNFLGFGWLDLKWSIETLFSKYFRNARKFVKKRQVIHFISSVSLVQVLDVLRAKPRAIRTKASIRDTSNENTSTRAKCRPLRKSIATSSPSRCPTNRSRTWRELEKSSGSG